MRIDIMGVGFDSIAPEQAVLDACDIMRSDEKAYIVTPNPEIVWICRRNADLRAAINGARLVLPDGIGIILGAKILGTPISGGRIPGINFATALFQKMAEHGGRIFLFGAKPGVADEAGQRLAEKHPGLIIAGAADGYFTDEKAVIGQINAAKPDLLLVCLGAPKQEYWMAENNERILVPLCIGLGGSLDVFAGRVKRAPVFFQKLGLEWLYRLIRQPRRIKRMIKLPLFVFALIIMRIRKKPRR